MNQAVLVLNADHSVINIISWRRAHALLDKGRAEVVEESDKTVRNTEGTYVFTIPAVIKLISFIKNVYNAKVTFSKPNLFVRDKNTCQYCGSKEKLTIDHVVPVSKGGETSWTNCVTSCSACNWKKGNKFLENSGLHLKKKPHQPSLVEYFQNRIEMYGLDNVLLATKLRKNNS